MCEPSFEWSAGAAITTLVSGSEHLVWMSEVGVVPVGAETALIGHDGWADGRCGDYAASRALLNDYRLIRELSGHSPRTRLTVLNALGDNSTTFGQADTCHGPLANLV